MYIYFCEKVQNTVQPHTGPVTTVRWCHYLSLCRCVPSWCSELQQFQRFAVWITFAASHQWRHNTEKWNPLQEQNGFYECGGRHCASSTTCRSYTTESWHRAFVNGAIAKWRESGACRIATTKCCQCVLLAHHTLLCSCCLPLFKFALMFHVALYGEFFLGDGLQKSGVSETFLQPSSGEYITRVIVYWWWHWKSVWCDFSFSFALQLLPRMKGF